VGHPAGARYTLVAFHAHPDDEVLLTGGTLARASAEGHRVVLITATAGDAGFSAAASGDALARSRREELRVSADALGVARLVQWDYADSGSQPPFAADGFAAADLESVAERLAGILREEAADVLLTYDAAGGYGHPDHVQVHRAGTRAAQLAGTPSVLEATIDRRALLRIVKVLGWLRRLPATPSGDGFRHAYTAHDRLTHRVDVRRHWTSKRAAMSAHVTQTSGGEGTRTLGLLLTLPGPVFRAALGREWFREQGRPPVRPLLDDVFAAVRA
jgi:LmbE family N-acetylglucosaminyl deacetylase